MSSTADSSAGFSTVAIVGVGLIGGSLGAALRKRELARVLGIGRDGSRLRAAVDAGVIDEGMVDLREGAGRADLVVFCTPVDRIAAGVREAAAACRPGTLLTDAGSAKGAICDALAEGLPSEVTFIGGHPLAGSEKQGFEFADPHLFEGRVCVITPLPAAPPNDVTRLTRFWESVGSRVVNLAPDRHDKALAQTSHLPHVVAAALAATLEPECAPLAATGFRDTTRIAGGDPDLWVAILLANADAVLASLQEYAVNLGSFTQAIAARDAGQLRTLLAEAQTVRQAFQGDPSTKTTSKAH